MSLRDDSATEDIVFHGNLAKDVLDLNDALSPDVPERKESSLTLPSQSNTNTGIIKVLPTKVVEKIAAGEVVQRASSAIKELLENSIDAQADTIRVLIQNPSATCLSFAVIDNGSGISKADLLLACTRHATSKMQTYQDLSSISSFGFRGEALAALSMVSRVTITSKTADSNASKGASVSSCAYQMQYTNGAPNCDEPTRTARTVGTTIQVNDLFYNLPHRQIQTSKKSALSHEYHMILKVLQCYSIHYAAQGIAISCQKQNNNSTNAADLNTSPFVTAIQKIFQRSTGNRCNSHDDIHPVSVDHSAGDAMILSLQEAATKNVIGHTFGSNLIPFLLSHSSCLYESQKNVDPSAVARRDDAMDSFDEKKDDTSSTLPEVVATTTTESKSIIYSCTGYITSPSYFHSTKKIGFQRATPIILFINHRLIDGCSVLRRTIEDVYVNYCKQKPPFLYLSIFVPPHTIDVNVHPTKREVVLLHMDEIRYHLAQQIKQSLEAVGYTVPTTQITPRDDENVTMNPYNIQRKLSQSQPQSRMDASTTSTSLKANVNSKPVIQPKNRIRTTRSLQAGSIEPFLVRKALSQTTQSQQSDLDSSNHGSSSDVTTMPSLTQTLDESTTSLQDRNCPLHDVSMADGVADLSVPGVFAAVAARCNCSKKMKLDLSHPANPKIVGEPILPSPVGTAKSIAAATGRALRLQRLSPSPCQYTSIQQLRKHTILKHRDDDLEKKLRGACFVGTLSHHRSLIQCGQELVLMNHFICAEELFYQLSLNQFGAFGIAKISGKVNNGSSGSVGIDIESVIGHFVQMEELLHHPSMNSDDVSSLSLPIKISETNQALAKQATACLWQHADMLLEYYSIKLEKDSLTGQTLLTGLPILIEGFEPSPHGLPLFLLRLASEVDWSEEKACFHGICRELGSFYAQLPSNISREDQAARVQHTLFPAITTLLIPTNEMKKNDFITLTSLPKLYRVFERC